MSTPSKELYHNFINKTKRIAILEQYEGLVDRSSIVSKSDKYGKITFVNEKFCEISGYTKEELIGKSHNILRHQICQKKLLKICGIP